MDEALHEMHTPPHSMASNGTLALRVIQKIVARQRKLCASGTTSKSELFAQDFEHSVFSPNGTFLQGAQCTF